MKTAFFPQKNDIKLPSKKLALFRTLIYNKYNGSGNLPNKYPIKVHRILRRYSLYFIYIFNSPYRAAYRGGL